MSEIDWYIAAQAVSSTDWVQIEPYVKAQLRVYSIYDFRGNRVELFVLKKLPFKKSKTYSIILLDLYSEGPQFSKWLKTDEEKEMIKKILMRQAQKEHDEREAEAKAWRKEMEKFLAKFLEKAK